MDVDMDMDNDFSRAPAQTSNQTNQDDDEEVDEDHDPVKFFVCGRRRRRRAASRAIKPEKGLKSAVWLHLGQYLDSKLLSLSSNSNSNNNNTSPSTTTAASATSTSLNAARPQQEKNNNKGRERYNMDPHFCASLTQLVCTQIELVALDMEAFARHAGRTTITVDDVLLLARRNEDLHRMLKSTTSASHPRGGRSSYTTQGRSKSKRASINIDTSSDENDDDDDDDDAGENEEDGALSPHRASASNNRGTKGSRARGTPSSRRPRGRTRGQV